MVRVMDLFAITPNFIIDSPDELTEEELVYYLATLKEIARIGGISSGEKKFGEYFVSALGISMDIVQKSDRLINENSLSMGELVSKIKTPWCRVCLLRDAYIMAMIDDDVDQVEWLALQRLSGTLGLHQSTTKKVIQLVDNIVDIQEDVKNLT